MESVAVGHLPSFITPPGETDLLYIIVGAALIVFIFMLGAFYFWLHSLPERMAHGASRPQLQLVAVLALIALFTHNNVFWIAALLLAAIPLPDAMTPINSIATSLARIADSRGAATNASETEER